MRRVTAAPLTFGACLLLVGATDARPQKPTKTLQVGSSFRLPPDSLNEMVRTADAVVRARVVGGSPRDIPMREGEPRVATLFRLRIIEVLSARGDRGVGPDEMTVVREGGERDRGSHIEQVLQDRFPPFEEGHEYVLFLAWNSALDDWVPAFGPDSAWDITSGQVHSTGLAKVTVERKGRSATEVLEQIRKPKR